MYDYYDALQITYHGVGKDFPTAALTLYPDKQCILDQNYT
jgi:hypothetical protein